MTKLNVASLDFLEVRNELKSYLNSQSRFKDYNWEGSNLAILLDILAYNTQIMAFYSNMSVNESFLDSAVLRNSATSIAKHLGYIPRSKTSAIAYLDLELTQTPAPSPLPTTILIPRYHQFQSVLNATNYSFYNLVPYTVTKDINDKYLLSNFKVVEGTKLTYIWTQTATAQRFIIPNKDVDITTLYLEVQESAGSTVKQIYTQVTDVNDLDPTSTKYFLQCNEDGLYEIYFGDNVLGKNPDAGSVISLTYLVSSGDAANGANSFTSTGSTSGGWYPAATTTEAAANGKDEESIESIKFYAPKTYEIQNRAVTKSDYKTLIMHDFPYLDSVRVWGGEENIPPRYGYVYICPKPSSGYIITERTKEYLKDIIIQKRNVVGIQTLIVDPEYYKIEVTSEVKFESSKTTKLESTISNIIRNKILDFASSELVDFDSTFRYSKLVKVIDAADPAILNNFTTIKLKGIVTPVWGSPREYTLNFNNAIDQGDVAHGEPTLESDPFYVDSLVHYLEDDGDGNIYMYRYVEGNKVVTINNIGTIDYTTGALVLSSFAPDSAYGSLGDDIHLKVKPVKNDITSLRNQILLIEDDDIDITLINESIS